MGPENRVTAKPLSVCTRLIPETRSIASVNLTHAIPGRHACKIRDDPQFHSNAVAAY